MFWKISKKEELKEEIKLSNVFGLTEEEVKTVVEYEYEIRELQDKLAPYQSMITRLENLKNLKSNFTRYKCDTFPRVERLLQSLCNNGVIPNFRLCNVKVGFHDNLYLGNPEAIAFFIFIGNSVAIDALIKSYRGKFLKLVFDGVVLYVETALKSKVDTVIDTLNTLHLGELKVKYDNYEDELCYIKH